MSDCENPKTLKDMKYIHLITLGGCIAKTHVHNQQTKQYDTIVDNRIVYQSLSRYADMHGVITVVWSNLFNKGTSWQIEDTEILRIKKCIIDSPYELILITTGTGSLSTVGSQLLDIAQKYKKRIIITGGWDNNFLDQGDFSKESRAFNLGNSVGYLMSLQEYGVWVCWSGIIRKCYVCDATGKHLLKIHNAYQMAYTLQQNYKL
jgi:L-asparaginase/Glu-tRNA(Gln) amidotransferase subunit D